jgi:hypothetical protein
MSRTASDPEENPLMFTGVPTRDGPAGNIRPAPFPPASRSRTGPAASAPRTALKGPTLRAGGYLPSFIEHRKRSEQAPVSVIRKAGCAGASARKIEAVLGELGVAGVSAGQASQLCAPLHEKVRQLREPGPPRHHARWARFARRGRMRCMRRCARTSALSRWLWSLRV